MERRVIILGSTGSIGVQTASVIDHLNALHARGEWPARLRVVGLAAGRGERALADQATRWRPDAVALAEGDGSGLTGRVLRGTDAAERLVRETDSDLVVAAIPGAAGIRPTFAALERGLAVAIANKETLVAAGELAVAACRRTGATLLPVDSEHSGVWQCLGLASACPLVAPADVTRVVLTASGGSLRGRPLADLEHATPEQALRHPTWSMGPKVTIDSASLMNKALEVIEAHWLFGVPAERLDAVVHPQSIVHCLVERADGSVLTQQAPPDMRLPIQLALTWPARAPGCARATDWAGPMSLTFEPVDAARYPAFGLAREALRRGGTAGAVLNGANEAAVATFLAGRCGFGAVARAVRAAVEGVGVSSLRSLDDALAADAEGRRFVAGWLAEHGAASGRGAT